MDVLSSKFEKAVFKACEEAFGFRGFIGFKWVLIIRAKDRSSDMPDRFIIYDKKSLSGLGICNVDIHAESGDARLRLTPNKWYYNAYKVTSKLRQYKKAGIVLKMWEFGSWGVDLPADRICSTGLRKAVRVNNSGVIVGIKKAVKSREFGTKNGCFICVPDESSMAKLVDATLQTKYMTFIILNEDELSI